MKRTLATTIFIIHYSLFIHSADTIQLNLTPLVDTYTQTEAGYWEDTYIDGVQIEDEMFRFAHTGSSDGGGGMAYWEGFTLCSSGDTIDYGAEGSSDGWILNQWGCMAGGGADSQGQYQGEGHSNKLLHSGFLLYNIGNKAPLLCIAHYTPDFP